MTTQDKSCEAFDTYITNGLFGENKAVLTNELTWYTEKYSADIERDFKLWQAAEAYGRKQALEEAILFFEDRRAWLLDGGEVIEYLQELIK